MAGGLEKRLAHLERLYSAAPGNLAEGPEGWREKLATTLRRGEEKAALERVSGLLFSFTDAAVGADPITRSRCTGSR